MSTLEETTKLEGNHYYTDKEFCDAMRIDRRTARRWRKNGYINYLKTPTGKIRYLQAHIDAFDRRGVLRAQRKEKKAA